MVLQKKITDEKEVKERIKKKLKRQKIYFQLGTLKPGDYLVHLDHGVGKFVGHTSIPHDREELMYYVLEYAAGDKLFVPVGLERKLSRYVGFEEPHISRLGSPFWSYLKENPNSTISTYSFCLTK